MELKTAQSLHLRTWYGVHATVTVGPGFVHKAGVGKVSIPHPPVINWLLRRGLSDETWLKLNFSHEKGHFQTAPLIVLYAIAVLTRNFAGGHFRIPETVFTSVGVQAAWEMLSEAVAIIGNLSYYRKCYEGTSKLPRMIFWTATGVLTAGGWFIAFA